MAPKSAPAAVPSPTLAKVRKAVPDSQLALARSISIFDDGRKAATKKTFGIRDIQRATVYFEKLSQHSKRPVTVKAEMKKGQWVVVSASDFKAYAQSVSGE